MNKKILDKNQNLKNKITKIANFEKNSKWKEIKGHSNRNLKVLETDAKSSKCLYEALRLFATQKLHKKITIEKCPKLEEIKGHSNRN